MNTRVSVQEAIDELVNVFPPSPLDPEHAFAEYGGTYLDAEDFKAGVRGRSWMGQLHSLITCRRSWSWSSGERGS